MGLTQKLENISTIFQVEENKLENKWRGEDFEQPRQQTVYTHIRSQCSLMHRSYALYTALLHPSYTPPTPLIQPFYTYLEISASASK